METEPGREQTDPGPVSCDGGSWSHLADQEQIHGLPNTPGLPSPALLSSFDRSFISSHYWDSAPSPGKAEVPTVKQAVQ